MRRTGVAGPRWLVLLFALSSACYASHEHERDAGDFDAGTTGACVCDTCGCETTGCADDEACDAFTGACELTCDRIEDCFPFLDFVCDANRCRRPDCRSDADCAERGRLDLMYRCSAVAGRAFCTSVCEEDRDCAAIGERAACYRGSCTTGVCRSDDECVSRFDERFTCRTR